MERFEPNGTMSSRPDCYDYPGFDDEIKELFNKNIKNMVKEMYEPINFCPQASFQKLQYWENERKPSDPGGFCAAWSAWYADTRLSNPNKSRSQVVKMSLDNLRNRPESLTQFIRSYAEFLSKIGGELQKNKNKDQVFQKYAQKYT
jgi:hypothetical protein